MSCASLGCTVSALFGKACTLLMLTLNTMVMEAWCKVKTSVILSELPLVARAGHLLAWGPLLRLLIVPAAPSLSFFYCPSHFPFTDLSLGLRVKTDSLGKTTDPFPYLLLYAVIAVAILLKKEYNYYSYF